MIVYNNNSAWTAVYLGNQQISKVHSSQAKVWPEEPSDFKFKLKYSGGDEYVKYCDGGRSITSAETKPSGYEYSAMTAAEIGNCENLNNISTSAFTNCKSLTSVTIPSNIKSLGGFVFYNDTQLVSVNLSEGLESMSFSEFDGCSSLTSITLPNSLRTLTQDSFARCGLTGITLPDSVTVLGGGSFRGNTQLVQAKLPSGLTSISNNLFKDCSALQHIVLPETLIEIQYSAFANCSALTSITIPSGVTSVGNSAFAYCTALTSITLPSGVTSVGYQAFFDCSGLTSITCLATTPPTLGNYVFSNTAECPILVPCESVSAYRQAPNWSNYASRIMPIAGSCHKVRIEYKNQMASPTVIDCSASTVVNVQETYNAMPDGNRYFGQQNASALTIGGCATSIEDSVFMSFTALTTVQLSDSLTSIGNDVFDNCKSLTSITFPDSVLSIGSSVCHSCSALTSATLPSGMTSVPDSAFAYCHSLSAFDFDGITSIGRSAFFQCSGMTSITLPSGLASIADTAFYQCKSLTSITCLATTPPTLGSSVFSLTNDCAIYVPSGSVSAYQSASGWSTYASRIQAIPTD